MRILLDVIHADGRVNVRGNAFFEELLTVLGLTSDCEDAIQKKSSIVALMDIKNFTQAQKRYLATLMDKMIKVDEDINVNEVAIYDVIADYCQIPIPFEE